MTKKTKQTVTSEKEPKRKKFLDWKDTRWVLNNLDEEQLVQMDNTPFDVARYMDWISHLVDMGIEVKLGWDDFSRCYVGTLMGSWVGYVNTGYAVSARSDSFEDIIKILWFKFEYLCDADMSKAYEQPKSRKRRG